MASKESNAINVHYSYLLNTMGADPDMPLDDIRVLFNHQDYLGLDAGGVDYIELECNGITCMWANPKGGSDKHVILYTHGGGYLTGSIYSHRKLVGHLAKQTGCRVLNVDYNLAPESPHPGPLNDSIKVYEWLLNEGYKPENIATSGDSAGGALCTEILIAARDRGLPLPAAGMPICPWYDLENSGDSMTSNDEKDCLVKKAVVDNMAEAFLAGGDPRDPTANALYADLTGLPPLYITVGSYETLLDDATRFEKKAKEAGVEVKLDIFPEMQHVWHFMAGAAPEADQAIKQMADWVKPKIGL